MFYKGYSENAPAQASLKKSMTLRFIVTNASTYLPKWILWEHTSIEITQRWRKRRWNVTHVITHALRKILLECIKAWSTKASSSKNEVLVMHKFRKHGGQEPPRKLFKVCDLTCLITGGLRFHKNAEPSRMEGPQGFKCDLCDYTDSKITPSESMLLFLKYYFKNIVLVWSVQIFMY